MTQLPQSIRSILIDDLQSGKDVYYGYGVENPEYLQEDVITRAIPTRSINLPESTDTFNYFFNDSSNTYAYSDRLYHATRDCTMEIIYTNGGSDNGNFLLEVYQKGVSAPVFSSTVTSESQNEYVTCSLKSGKDYYIKITQKTYNDFDVYMVIHAY